MLLGGGDYVRIKLFIDNGMTYEIDGSANDFISQVQNIIGFIQIDNFYINPSHISLIEEIEQQLYITQFGCERGYLPDVDIIELIKQLNTYYNASTKDIASIIDDIAPKNRSKKKLF